GEGRRHHRLHGGERRVRDERVGQALERRRQGVDARRWQWRLRPRARPRAGCTRIWHGNAGPALRHNRRRRRREGRERGSPRPVQSIGGGAPARSALRTGDPYEEQKNMKNKRNLAATLFASAVIAFGTCAIVAPVQAADKPMNSKAAGKALQDAKKVLDAKRY